MVGQPWSDPLPIVARSNEQTLVAIVSRRPQSFHSLWRAGGFSSVVTYAAPVVASAEMTGGVSQEIAIPATMHRPTLSFMYSLLSSDLGKSHFGLTLSDGITTTELFSTAHSAPWVSAWSDLEPWAGQTVTVTFSIHQAADDAPIHAYLDDVSLSAWERPIPMAVAPARISVGVAATMIISGENFIATPNVKLGDRLLSSPQLVDDHTLRVDIPVDLAPGIYDLWVINPGGQTGVQVGAVAIGEQVYLPLIAR